MARHKTVTFRFDERDHEILNSLAKARGQNKTQVLKRMLREEEAREKIEQINLVESAANTSTTILWSSLVGLVAQRLRVLGEEEAQLCALRFEKNLGVDRNKLLAEARQLGKGRIDF
jgi:hypothetical protein